MVPSSPELVVTLAVHRSLVATMGPHGLTSRQVVAGPDRRLPSGLLYTDRPPMCRERWDCRRKRQAAAALRGPPAAAAAKFALPGSFSRQHSPLPRRATG